MNRMLNFVVACRSHSQDQDRSWRAKAVPGAISDVFDILSENSTKALFSIKSHSKEKKKKNGRNPNNKSNHLLERPM